MASSSRQPVSLVPPPSGLESNFVNPPTQTAGTIALHTTCLSLATLCVAIRIYTRKFIMHDVGLDDCKNVLSSLTLL